MALWWGCPQVAFGGATPAGAVDRLVGFVPEDQRPRAIASSGYAFGNRRHDV
jgi:hypothetical protein